MILKTDETICLIEGKRKKYSDDGEGVEAEILTSRGSLSDKIILFVFHVFPCSVIVYLAH